MFNEFKTTSLYKILLLSFSVPREKTGMVRTYFVEGEETTRKVKVKVDGETKKLLRKNSSMVSKNK